MRIALVAPEFPACGPAYGIGRYLSLLAEGLQRRGHRVLVLAATGAGLLRQDGSTRSTTPAPIAARGPLRPRAVAPWLSSQLAGWRPDVVELSNWGGLGAALRCEAPTLCRLSSSIAVTPGTGPARALRRLHLANERRTVRRCRALIADSTAAAGMAWACYHRRADGIIAHGIPTGVADTGTDDPLEERRDLLYVGRLERRKGIDRLLRAWPLMASRLPGSVLHVVGADPAGLGGRVRLPRLRFHGRLDDTDLVRLRRRCALQLVPSRFESFGLVVLEAWRDGLAVVASDGGALSEVVGSAGIVVAAANPASLAAAAGDLMADPERIRGLAAAGRRRLEERFAADRFVAQSERWYRKLIP